MGAARGLRLVLGLAVLAMMPLASASAQPISLAPDLTLDLAGGVQPRVSLGVQGDDDDTRYGAGLRRARIQARVLYRDVGGVEYDVDGAGGFVQSVDMFAFANLSPEVQTRVGYFPIAQPRGGVLTPYFAIDAVDRPAVIERWLGGTLGGDGRDLGADLTYRSGPAFASLAVHNGAGTYSGSVRQGISSTDVTGGTETRGLAVSAAGSYALASGVEVGAFGTVNGADPARTSRGIDGRDYTSGGAHVYWGADPGSQPIRLKLDGFALRYADDGAGAQEAAGVSAFGALGLGTAAEAFARGERFWSDTGSAGDNYLTAGVSYSPSAALGGPYQRARLTLAYHYRDGDALPDAHLVILQGQLAF